MNQMKLMKPSKKIYIGAGLLVFFVAVMIFPHLQKKTAETSKIETTITFKNIVVHADVADTEPLREKGLSGRASLQEGRGMWFEYEKNGIYSFWMPDMHFPIDIIWFDENFKAVYIRENVTPESYPEIFTPDTEERYVLEVPAGFVKKYGISLGEKVSATNTP